MHTIAIIGAGFSGSLVGVHLLREARVPVRVVLIERTGVFGPGLAYGYGSESLLLNVVAGRMSALPDEPDHFLRWAKRQDPNVRGEMFLPRRMYGRYIADLLESACREAEPGCVLERVTDEVTDIVPVRGGAKVVCRNGGDLRVDAVVLAPGNAPPARPSWCDETIEASGLYIGDPWRGEGLSKVRPDDSIVIVGTGLTMMDAALSLEEAGHRGTIDAVSRRGLLPQPHRHGNPDLAKLPDPLFRGTFSNLRDLLRFVRTEAQKAQSRGGDWRDAINAMRSITPSLWKGLNERERRRFLEHLMPFWNSHRHRAPQSVAEGIQRLRDEGRLRIHSARVTGVRVVGGRLEVDLLPRGGDAATSGKRLIADRIINCTGPATNVRQSGIALLDRLLEAGVVRPGPLGMGLDCDDEGRVIRADGTVDEHVLLIGPARIGQLWETTAAPELRVQAVQIAKRVMQGFGATVTTSGVAVAGARVEPV